MAVADNNKNCRAGNNKQNAAGGSGSSGDTVAAAIVAARLNSDRTVHKRRGIDGRDEGGEVVMWNLFMFVIFFTLISSVPVDRSEGSTKFLCLCKIYT